MTINELKDRAYKIACEHGWYDEEHSLIHHLMLVITELSEAVNADRKKKYAQREMFERESVTPQANPEEHWCYCYHTFIKDTVEDELADAVIRILSLAGQAKADLDERLFDEGDIREAVKAGHEDSPFTEQVFTIVYELTSKHIDENWSLTMIMLHFFLLSYDRGIDLHWHIEQKLKYNEHRSYKHGKAY